MTHPLGSLGDVTSAPIGWRPLQRPDAAGRLNRDFRATPFMWLARMHASSAVADGLITAALAGSIFFNISPTQARTRVALTLLITVLPYALVTPFIGPAIDRARGGRRSMLTLTNAGRALIALLMIGHIKTLLLFPEALVMLVLKSGSSIATRAVVPTIVDNDRKLVEANSKLALISALGNMAGVIVGGITNFIIGPGAVAFLAMVGFAIAGAVSFKLPRIAVADEPATTQEKAELASIGIRLAGSSMSVIRGIVGFLSLMLAFELRGGKKGVDLEPDGAAAGAATAIVRRIDIVGDPAAPKWHFGVVLIAAGIGGLVGSRIAPILRQRWIEERLLQGVLLVVTLAAGFAAWTGGLSGALAITLAVGVGAATGKLAFDSLVQRDAPDANYGRSFARFEARFQMFWVLGALFPTALKLKERFGFTLIALAAGLALVSYVMALRSPSGKTLLGHLRDRTLRPPPPGSRTPAPLEPTAELPATGDEPTAVMPAAPAGHDPTAVMPAAPPPAPARRWNAPRAPKRARRRKHDQLELFDD